MKSIVKFVIVSKQTPTTFDVEDLKSLAIQQAARGEQVPVLMTCGDPIKNPLTVEEMELIREMIDSESAWVRLGDKIASLVILQI